MTRLSRLGEGLCAIEFDRGSLAEASALVTVESQELLSTCGWDLGFWMARDEPAVEKAIVLIGRRSEPSSSSAGWEIMPVRLRAHDIGGAAADSKTSDSEALALRNGWVYVIGSHFGSERHGLQGKRAFVARFQECDVDIDVEARPAVIEVMKDEFRVHRLVNDALKASGVLPPQRTTLGRRLEHGRKAYIKKTLKQAEGRSWADRLSDNDWPINIEGATFHSEGSLMLGLRFPVASGGHPTLVQIDGIERLFANGEPTLRRVIVLEGIGTAETPVEAAEESIHVLVGNVEKELFDDYREKPLSAHWQAQLRSLGGDRSLRVTRVREFPEELGHIEGLTVDKRGRVFYVCDDENCVRVLFDSDG
jgi:hypothetical protein